MAGSGAIIKSPISAFFGVVLLRDGDLLWHCSYMYVHVVV
jgi:hypothetical protein